MSFIYKYGGSKVFAESSNEIKISSEDIYGEGNTGPGGVGEADVAAILNVVYIVAGMVAVIAIIIGGVRYTVSNGDSSGVQAAKNTIMYAVVGLIVVIAAAAITNFVIEGVTKTS